MKTILTVLIFCCLSQVSLGQATDIFGRKGEAVRLPSEIEKNRTVRIGQMDIGEHVQVYSNAMVVDDNGRCWLNPRHLAFPIKDNGDLEVINNKLGYIVRVNFKYAKVNGYSVPRWPNFERGYVPPGWIPVKGIAVVKPFYRDGSPYQKLSSELSKPYNPRFAVPAVPPNPYSWEKQDVRLPNPRTGSSGTTPSSTGSVSPPSPSPIPIP